MRIGIAILAIILFIVAIKCCFIPSYNRYLLDKIDKDMEKEYSDLLDTADYYYNNSELYEDNKAYEEAFHEYLELANKNSEFSSKSIMEAQTMVGVCLKYGKGVEQSNEKAVEWYTKAAEQGYAHAEEALENLKKS